MTEQQILGLATEWGNYGFMSDEQRYVADARNAAQTTGHDA